MPGQDRTYINCPGCKKDILVYVENNTEEYNYYDLTWDDVPADVIKRLIGTCIYCSCGCVSEINITPVIIRNLWNDS